MLVLFCAPQTRAFNQAFQRHYLGVGSCPGQTLPLLKPAVAVPGDTVILSDEGVQVNNGKLLANSRRLQIDSQSRPLTTIKNGAYKVQPNELWVISTYSSHSFDSRYFGPINSQNVQGIVTPFWTMTRSHSE